MRFPSLEGRPVEVRFVRRPRDRRGEIHGGALLRERRILLDAALRRRRSELARILAHELYHFAWVRLGNPARRSWEELLRAQWGRPGELGWSAEWRKAALTRADVVARGRRWREYCCESFCDTAAWLLAGIARHPEFTLAASARAARREWFSKRGLTSRISI